MYVPLGWPPQTVNKIVIALPGSGAQFKGEIDIKVCVSIALGNYILNKNNNK